MDDIRRPHHQRRDFAMRHRPHQPPPSPNSPAPGPAPAPAIPHHTPAAVPQDGLAPAAASETGYEHYGRPAPRPNLQPAAKKKLLPKIRPRYAAAGLAAVLLIAAGAYLLTRPAQKSGFSVAQLAKKSAFSFYYPQPLPNGYAYVTKINAFQGGQAYFMLANGSKHIIFREQAAGGQTTGGLSGSHNIRSAAGTAAIGTQAGQPAAKVLAGSTLISINTTGSVPSADLTWVIDSLKTDR